MDLENFSEQTKIKINASFNYARENNFAYFIPLHLLLILIKNDDLVKNTLKYFKVDIKLLLEQSLLISNKEKKHTSPPEIQGNLILLLQEANKKNKIKGNMKVETNLILLELCSDLSPITKELLEKNNLFYHNLEAYIVEILSKENVSEQVTRKSFIRFYLPLAITPLASLLIHPVGSAGMSRMPEALPSLAAWPVVYGLVFITRSLGFAFNEVVVALLPHPNGKLELLRFTRILAISTSAFLGVLALTPIGGYWFLYVAGLSEELAYISSITLVFAILMPGYQAYQAWYSGLLVNKSQTNGISFAVLIYAIIAIIGLWLGTRFATFPGIYWAVNVFVFAGLSQTLYLRYSYKRIG